MSLVEKSLLGNREEIGSSQRQRSSNFPLSPFSKLAKKKVVFCDLINWNYFYVFKANRIAFSDKKNGQTSSIRIGICGFMCLNFHSKVMADMRPVYFVPSCCCLNPVWKIQAENNQMSQTQLKQSAYTNISTEGFLLYPQIQRQCNKVKT